MCLARSDSGWPRWMFGVEFPTARWADSRMGHKRGSSSAGCCASSLAPASEVPHGAHLHQSNSRKDRRHVRQPFNRNQPRAGNSYSSVRIDIRRIVSRGYGRRHRRSAHAPRSRIVKTKSPRPSREVRITDISLRRGHQPRRGRCARSGSHPQRRSSKERRLRYSFNGERNRLGPQ